MEMKDFLASVPDHWARHLDKSYWNFIVALPEELSEYTLDEWCKDNCTEQYYVYNGAHVLFEDVEDAVGFKLRWL